MQNLQLALSRETALGTKESHGKVKYRKSRRTAGTERSIAEWSFGGITAIPPSHPVSVLGRSPIPPELTMYALGTVQTLHTLLNCMHGTHVYTAYNMFSPVRIGHILCNA